MRTAIPFWLALAGFLQAGGLTYEKELLEIHAAADAKSVVADFKFENKTDRPVTIAKVDKTCSCVSVQVADSKLTYAPGESGLIRAVFEMGNFSGVVDKTVAIWHDKDPEDKPSQILTVRVHIPVLVVMDVKTLKWAIGANPDPQKIDITMADTKPIRILSTSCTSESFKIELKTLEEGQHYQLLVTPDDTKQPGLAIIRIETDCENPRHKLQQVFATIRRELPAIP
ncbi:MAG: DUF1573 domain-containing protein [Verrucomicrobia bacterium]|nr:DUF1573 domain-containing protein [Verrucomicrobiota bacterium]